MGWLFTKYQTRKALIRRRTEREENDVRIRVCLASCWRGNITHAGRLWSVQEVSRKDASGAVIHSERFIALDLCAYEADFGWGYKDLDESCGPYEVDCPEKYLDMVPEPDHPHAKAWRIQVRAFHKARHDRDAIIKNAKYGDVIVLKPGSNPSWVRVVGSCKPRMRHFIGEFAGTRYNVSANHVVENYGHVIDPS